jgi:hypothetical protein
MFSTAIAVEASVISRGIEATPQYPQSSSIVGKSELIAPNKSL